MGSIEHLCEQLQQLQPSERAWFWFNPDLPDAFPMLLLEPLRTDPKAEQLRLGSRPLRAFGMDENHTGAAQLDVSGRVQLLTPELTTSHLQQLSDWVRVNVKRYPALAHLRDAHIIPLTATGELQPALQLPEAWQGIPRKLRRGTIAHSARVLARLRPLAKARVWMTAQGPFGSSTLVLAQADRAEALDEMMVCVQVLLQGTRHAAPSASGILKHTADGELVFVTAASPDKMSAIVDTLVAEHPSLSSLSAARVISLQHTRAASDDTVQSTARSLATPSNKRWFFLLGRTADDEPFLWLDTRERATAEARECQVLARGKARRSAQGTIDFRTTDSREDFIDILLQWVRMHEAQAPALSVLRGARLTVVDDQGSVQYRIDSAAYWE